MLLEVLVCPGPMITQFNVYYFVLILWDVALVRSPVGEDFWPVFGIGINPAL